MYSWATASSSSVVTPGAMAFEASTMAVAAMRDAMRIFSMVSASLMRTSPSSRGLGTST